MDTIDLTATLPDHLFDAADSIEDALHTERDLTPSRAARAAKIDTTEAHRVLTYMVRHGYAVTSGNGARTHYHPAK